MAHRQDSLSLNFLPLGFFLLSVSISSSGGKTSRDIVNLATEDKIPTHRFSYLSLFPRQRLERKVYALDLDIFLPYLDMAVWSSQSLLLKGYVYTELLLTGTASTLL